jgi:hypothetical protein
MEYYISVGVDFIYGQRIFIKADYLDMKAKEVLDRLSCWGGHDKRYAVDENDPDAVWWLGWEFESNPNRTASLEAALLWLGALGYVETKECPY